MVTPIEGENKSVVDLAKETINDLEKAGMPRHLAVDMVRSTVTDIAVKRLSSMEDKEKKAFLRAGLDEMTRLMNEGNLRGMLKQAEAWEEIAEKLFPNNDLGPMIDEVIADSNRAACEKLLYGFGKIHSSL